MDNSISYNYIQEGKEIWYKNPLDSPTDMPYLLRTVKSKDDLNKICILENNESIQYSNTLPYYNDPNINIDDLSLLDDINEMDILNNSLNRFISKIYFTNIGDILLFLNPYINKEQIYNEEILSLYNKKNFEMKNTIYVQPHLYKNIYNILKKFKEGKINKQAILVQGECCTGKTEIINQSIKYILSYLKDSNNFNDNNTTKKESNNNLDGETNIEKDKDIDSSLLNLKNSETNTNDYGYSTLFNFRKFSDLSNDNIAKKIISSSIVLEAFANAKTLNNDNSTRAIEFIKLKFDKNFSKIIGSEVSAFLFDKNRVSSLEQNKGNNFNIFYYLIKSGNNDLLKKLFLDSDNIANYNYLNSNNSSIDNSSYTKSKFKQLRESLITLGFNNGEMFTIFKIISAIILLGNVEIKIDSNFQLLLNENEIFLNICDLLNIDSNEFISALINQEASIGINNINFNKNSNTLNKKNNNYYYYNGNEEIEKIKNNFANELYNQLFLWIINKINNNINAINSLENEDIKTITFFDFCGFENNYSYKFNDVIYLNSIEQLFANYVNELIFYFYLKDYFLTNLKFFQQEGVNYIADKIQIEYNNKRDILNSINYLLNDLKNMKNDKDIKTFILDLGKDTELTDQNSKKRFKKLKSFKMIKNSSNSRYFLIHHTNEDVFYNLNGFLSKNLQNYIPWNLLDCLLKSINPIIKNIYKNNRLNTILENNAFENKLDYDYDDILNNGFVTFGEEYKYFIKEIKKEIKQSKRNYIICIKSNQSSKPLVFTPNYIFNQIKYFKILFSIKQLEKNCFPIIMTFNDFYDNYRIVQNYKYNSESKEKQNNIIDSNSPHSTDVNKKRCINIINYLIKQSNENDLKKLLINEDIILFGKNKILMREKLFNILEKERKEIVDYKKKMINYLIVGINHIKYKENYNNLKTNKKDCKIAKIQALIKTCYDKNQIIKYNGLIYFLQNSLRVICAKKKIENIKNKRQFLIIRLKLFLEKNKKIECSNNNIAIIKKVTKKMKDNSFPFLRITETRKYNKSLLNKHPLLNDILEHNSNNNKHNDNINGNNDDINNYIDENNYGSQKNENDNIDINLYSENDINNNDIYQDEEENINIEEEKNIDENGININDDINKNSQNNNQKNKLKEKDKRLTILNPKKYKKLENNNELKNKIYLHELKKEKKPLLINQIKCKVGLKLIQQNTLFYKVMKRKKSIKAIYSHFTSQIYSKKYILIKDKLKIIQKYVKQYFENKKNLNNALELYMNNNFMNKADEMEKKINKILFPYRKQNFNKEKCIINNDINSINNKQINKNTNLNKEKTNKKNPKENLDIYKNYIKYKKNKQIYEYSVENKYVLNQNNNPNKDIYKNLNQSKEEEKEINYTNLSEDSQNNYNIVYKLIKDIPNLSRKTRENNISSATDNNKVNPNENNFDNKIYFISKIVDVDILTEIYEEEFNEILWMEEYKKIYEYNLINKTPIQQIYLSDTHTLLINNIGNIFLFGFNNKGQCGFFPKVEESEENINYIYSDMSISLYQYFDNLYGKIKKASLGDGYTLILNNEGKIFSFGDYLNPDILNNSIINLESKSIGKQSIKNINGNGNINIYLTKSNDIFINFKSNKYFRQNINNSNTNNSTQRQSLPIQILLDKKIKISSISCGYNFYILLSLEGKLYSGGTNQYGELGSNENNSNSRLTPEEIFELSKLNEKIIQVCCGFKHAMALSSKNNVYGWGNNSYGQLFSKNLCKKSPIIKLNSENNKDKIIQISTGFRSSFIMNDKHEIFYFGVLNRNKKNISGKGEQILIEEKNNEYGDKNDFVPVKMNSTWNKYFSLFYVTFADIRNISFKIEDNNRKNENKNIKKILRIISSNWLNNSIKLPYISEISQYFNKNYMEESNKSKTIIENTRKKIYNTGN